jgi:WD40 repeat protein
MIKLWDLNTGQEIMTYSGHNSMADCVAFSPDGERIISGGADGEIKIWDVKDKTTGLELKGHRQYVDSFAFSPNGNLIVTCSHDSAIKLWDVASAAEISTMGEFMSWYPLVAYHPNGKLIALGNMGDGRIVIWDTTTKKVLRTISGHEADITGIAFSSDGRRLVTASLDNYVEFRIMPSVTKLMLFKRWISRLGHPSLGIIRCARCRCRS